MKKLTFLFLMAVLSGCVAHENIVEDVTMKRMRLTDVKTGKKRTYESNNDVAMQNVLLWLANGDTVSLKSDRYVYDTLFNPQNSHLVYDSNKLYQRKDAFEREKIRQLVNKEFARQPKLLNNNNKEYK
ncbi:MAG: hypothetical protein J6Y07_00555 [Alphaproteobacteria bacterium]|nr:hypothetical protein [Alphaproteobacteria bacterium]